MGSRIQCYRPDRKNIVPKIENYNTTNKMCVVLSEIGNFYLKVSNICTKENNQVIIILVVLFIQQSLRGTKAVSKL